MSLLLAVQSSSTILAVAFGSYTYTGEATTDLDIAIKPAFGSYTYTGFADTFKITMVSAFGSYTYTGKAVTFDIKLIVSNGSYTYTGEAVTSLDRGITSAFGAYTSTGFADTFNIKMVSAFGSYTYTGEPTVLKIAQVSAFGSYAYTGFADTFDIKMVSAFGSYVYTGFDTATPSTVFLVDTGHYTYTGFSVDDKFDVGFTILQKGYGPQGTFTRQQWAQLKREWRAAARRKKYLADQEEIRQARAYEDYQKSQAVSAEDRRADFVRNQQRIAELLRSANAEQAKAGANALVHEFKNTAQREAAARKQQQEDEDIMKMLLSTDDD